MLGRHFLRIKVFQNLYALEHHKKGNFKKAENTIEQFFEKQIVTQGFEFTETIQAEKIKALAYLHEKLSTKNQITGLSDDTKNYVEEAFKSFKKDNCANIKGIYNNLVKSYENVFQTYTKVFIFLKLLANKIDEIHTSGTANQYISSEIKLDPTKLKNFKPQPFIAYLFKNAYLKYTETHLVSTFDKELITLTIKYLQEKKAFDHFIEKDQNTLPDSITQSKALLKTLLKRKSPLYLHFQDKDLYWKENVSIVVSLIKKHLDPENELDIFDFLVEENQIGDKDFIHSLFHKTINEDKRSSEYIAAKSHKWSLDRFTQTDKILLNMGICELLHFQSIPVKVTINEYIEIAKLYSTPKSKTFINGILDSFYQHVSKKGLLVKTGRGLIE